MLPQYQEAPGFGSNPHLKPCNYKIEYTAEMIQEWQKCASDPVYFINNYVKIVTLDGGIQSFSLYPCQVKKINVIHNNRKIILMEGRQQGKTVSSAAYILWYVLFNDVKTVAILAHKASGAREVMARLQFMYEQLPLFLQQGIKTWNKGDIELENGSKVFTQATTTSGIRGKSPNLLYIDECAFVPTNVAEQFFTSTFPAISAGNTTKILMSSTPKGYNHFWKFWKEAEEGINGFVNLFIPYWEIPGRDESWVLEQKRNLGEVKFAQEVACDFIGSAYTLINADGLRKFSPIRPLSSVDGLDILEYPKPDRVYCLIADVAKGVGGDYSAFSVVDITDLPYKQVAKYRDNNISPLLYPSVIYKAGMSYNQAYVLVEINISEQVAHILYYEMEYENILFVGRSQKGQQVSSGFSKGVTMLGVNTDRKVKRIGCTNLKSLIEEGKLLVQDSDTIAEFSNFVQVKDSYAADEGYHDDLVMPLVLFGWFTSNPSFRDFSDFSLRHAMYEKRMQAIEDEMVPTGFFNDGTEVQEQIVHNF